MISGGGSTRNGTGTSFWDFTNSPPTASAGPAGGNIIAAGGGYMGIAGNAATTLTFNTGLVGFGITGLPHGATRHARLTLTLSDDGTTVGSNDVVGTSAVFLGFELTPTEIANGLTISSVAFAHPDGVNRYDDLAFITAVPEAPAFDLCGAVVVRAVGLRYGANALRGDVDKADRARTTLTHRRPDLIAPTQSGRRGVLRGQADAPRSFTLRRR